MNNNKVEMTKSTTYDYEIRVGLGLLLKIIPLYCSLFHIYGWR
jgi:hypothetical protein